MHSRSAACTKPLPPLQVVILFLQAKGCGSLCTDNFQRGFDLDDPDKTDPTRLTRPGFNAALSINPYKCKEEFVILQSVGFS